MEDYKQLLYKDSRGIWTCGFGRNMESKGLSYPEALILLKNDVDECEKELLTHISFYKDLDCARQVVLLNMCFNIGLEGLMGFKKMLDLVGEGQYQIAAQEMLASSWAKQLPARAALLSLIMEKGHI
jgi:lysozyme